MGAAAENRPVMGRYELEPDEALILEVEPPEGVYWNYSIGNQWMETTHNGRHQSSLNAHQATVDADGILRVVVSARDPGVANWFDTDLALCADRDRTHANRAGRRFDDIASELPTDTARVNPAERAAVIAARRRAVHERFSA